MAAIIDQSDIDVVLTVFEIPRDEYYLSFEKDIDTIYLHWVVNCRTLKGYLKNNHQCLDVKAGPDDDWIDASLLEASELATTFPKPVDGFFSCRYILSV